MRQRVADLIAIASDTDEKNADKAADATATLRQLFKQLDAWKKQLERCRRLDAAERSPGQLVRGFFLFEYSGLLQPYPGGSE